MSEVTTPVPVPNPHTQLPPLPPEITALAPDVDLPDPMEAPGLGWAVLGAGGIARTFATAVQNWTRSTVTAVGARDVERARAFAGEFAVPHAFGSYEEAVACPEVDAVYVATIHPTHAEVALAAIAAGKHVLVEKPFTMDAQQARRVIDAARDAGVFLMEAMWTRHLPHHVVARAILASGNLGDVVQVRADHGQALRHVDRLMVPELGGGALLDLGVYSVSFVQSVLGSVEVDSVAATWTDTGVDETVQALLRGSSSDEGEGGTGAALGNASCSLAGRSATSAEVVCERGALEFPLQFYRPGQLLLRTFSEGGHPDGDVTAWDATVPGGFQYQVAEVARCVTAGVQQSPAVPWRDTVAVMDLLDRIGQVAREV
ncbi:Gfo/Idh/MocA family oxidoreductase [Schaalia sp. 19OD2882]|uniref:Gfo/Idh/MocA family protein n=1 Tax=Schaalia sp. 19OD2882 TaxID=2794089 RepID=UPI001C1EC7E9|nr:Gfo/Idh/MocA family oxidoreductase [Schaalia sp. 19OD2882]QWW19504.1 Gfo/Idh/MocA family oxidoreductase [Schaalia sp. 19OD2882]